MGITISNGEFSLDMGYGGFNRFRTKVAYLANEEFGNHYDRLGDALCLNPSMKTIFFEAYDAKTKTFIATQKVTVEVANFCFQSDVEGALDSEQVRQVYQLLESVKTDEPYGYVGRADCTKMSDLQRLFREAIQSETGIDWS